MTDISRLVQRYQDRLHKVGGAVFAQEARDVAAGTPVDSGVLRQSWTPDVNQVNGSNAGGNPSAIANNYNLGDTLTYTNGQPYARRIEYDSHSPQAPAGMMRVAIAGHQRITDEKVREAGGS